MGTLKINCEFGRILSISVDYRYNIFRRDRFCFQLPYAFDELTCLDNGIAGRSERTSSRTKTSEVDVSNGRAIVSMVKGPVITVRIAKLAIDIAECGVGAWFEVTIAIFEISYGLG